MANQLRLQKLSDSSKKAIIKLVGTFTQAQTNTTIVDSSTLSGALNANGYIMTANADPLAAYGLNITRIIGEVRIANGYAKLQWRDDANSEIIIFGSGEKSIDLTSIEGSGTSIGSQSGIANNTGDILLSTYGTTANDHCTLIIEVRKNPAHFNQGQINDPDAFNI